MSDFASRLVKVYRLAANGRPDAEAFLFAWHGWIHEIDDFVDEEGRRKEEVVDLCVHGSVLCSSEFWVRHCSVLAPVLGVIAEKWRSSLKAPGPLVDVLRLAGNDMVLLVAYITGGPALVRAVSERLWPLVAESQIDESIPG